MTKFSTSKPARLFLHVDPSSECSYFSYLHPPPLTLTRTHTRARAALVLLFPLSLSLLPAAILQAESRKVRRRRRYSRSPLPGRVRSGVVTSSGRHRTSAVPIARMVYSSSLFSGTSLPPLARSSAARFPGALALRLDNGQRAQISLCFSRRFLSSATTISAATLTPRFNQHRISPLGESASG